MTTLLHFGEGALTLGAGLVVRIAISLLFLAAIAIPILLAFEAWIRLAPLRARVFGPRLAGGIPWREDLYYASGHTWLKRGLWRATRVGIDGLVQRLVPDVRRVDLPVVGSRVHRGEVAARIWCIDREAEIVSAVEGTVTRINESLVDDPALVVRDPYGLGWLYAVETPGRDLPGLSHGEAARKWLQTEGARLQRLLERDLGVASADGGDLLGPPPQLMTDERWKALTDSFLKVA